MFQRIVIACLVAGVVAGSVSAGLQHFTTTPLILAAEVYETGSGAHAHPAAAAMAPRPALLLIHGEAVTLADPGAAAPDTIRRSLYTAVSTVATATGFAAMLLGAMLLTGAAITARTGLAWGAAAFAAAALAPGLGLSPELPGAAAADLGARQLWWTGTVLATAAGLWLALRVSTPMAVAAGLVLILLPHIVGAPHPAEYTSPVPSELAGHFAAASLVVQAAVWALVGTIAGYVWHRGEAGTA